MTSRGWVGHRWLQILDDLAPAHARDLQRGRALARRGAVDDLRIAPGAITAIVREERNTPHDVELRWPVAGAGAWQEAAMALGAELRFTAALLEGNLPVDAEEMLARAGIPLMPDPSGRGDLARCCTCASPSSWCRHVVAVFVTAAQAFERDPFLLLQFRGRGRDELLHALRADRDNRQGMPGSTAVDLSHGLEGARGDLAAVALAPRRVDDPYALVRHLGDPPGVDDPTPLVEVIDRAAATAWRLAAGEGVSAADEELLLAELRAQRVGTPASLAGALGRDAAEVRTELDRLFEVGTVMRTGTGDDVRYRTK